MKQLIVTADDFGYSINVNNAITKCFRYGIVTSASLIANSNYFNGSISLLKQNKGLDAGLHINLTEFKPLTDTKTLADKGGNFVGKTEWLNGHYRYADKNEVENEIETQITKALSSGLNITHINGHNHAHIFPNVIDIVIKLAKKYRIGCIRLPDEKITGKSRESSNEMGKSNIPAMFSKHAKIKILKSGLKTTNSFYGILNMGNMDFDKLHMMLKSMHDGTAELMVHPAYIGKRGDAFHQSRQRENEIKLLTNSNVKKLIKKYNIKLTSFSQI